MVSKTDDNKLIPCYHRFLIIPHFRGGGHCGIGKYPVLHISSDPTEQNGADENIAFITGPVSTENSSALEFNQIPVAHEIILLNRPI